MDKNEIEILGNVGEDPKYFKEWDMCTLSIATKNRWKQKDDSEWSEKTTWHSCSAFGKVAKIIMDKIHKGDRVMVNGRMDYSAKENKDGVKVNYATINIQKIYSPPLRTKEPEEKEDDLPF